VLLDKVNATRRKNMQTENGMSIPAKGTKQRLWTWENKQEDNGGKGLFCLFTSENFYDIINQSH